MIPSAPRAATCVVAIPCLLRGGTERQTLALVSALASDGWSVSVVAYHEHDLDMASEFSAAGADVTCLGWPRSVRGVRFVRRLASVLRSQAPEVVHVQYMQPGLLPVVAGRVAGVPHVLATVHHLPPAAARRARTLLRTAFRLCDRMLFVSEAARTDWLGARGDRAGRSAVVHNPVDLAGVDRALASRRDDAGPPRDDGTASRPLRVGTVARLETIKGVDVLLDAFARSRHRGDAELWIGGGGSLRRGLEARSRAVGVAERVRWLGPLAWQDAVRALASMDVVVVPSRSEGFGLVAAEAMACGRPVVASRVGGLVEVVEDGATGRLVPAEDPVAVAAAVDELLENPSQRRAWGEAARGRARSEFSLERYRAAVVETHRACLRPTAPGRAARPVSVRSAP